MAQWTWCNQVLSQNNAQTSIDNRLANPTQWDFVPVAVCISLQERMDRTLSAAKEFYRVGLSDKVLFYRPQKDKENGKRGCYTSHRAVCEWAKQNNRPWILIFEDDVEFETEIQRLNTGLENARASLRYLEGKRWDVLHLGHLPYMMVPYGSRNPYLRRTYSVCMHSYFANHTFIDWIIDHPFQKGTFGLDFYVLWFHKTFCVYPMIAYQKPMGSNIEHAVPNTGVANTKKSLRKMEGVQSVLMETHFFVFIAILLAILFYLQTKTNK